MENEVMQLFDSIIEDADNYIREYVPEFDNLGTRIEFAKIILMCKFYQQAMGKREAHQKFVLVMKEVDMMYKKLCDKEANVDGKIKQLNEKINQLSDGLDNFATLLPKEGDADG